MVEHLILFLLIVVLELIYFLFLIEYPFTPKYVAISSSCIKFVIINNQLNSLCCFLILITRKKY